MRVVEPTVVLRHHPEQHYSTIFNCRTGFFVRIEDSGYCEPKWAKLGPELIDISITNWCDRGCAICYRRSNTHGRHMSLLAYRSILSQAAKIGVMQVALGGGNPNQHPSFLKILQVTREDYGVVPTYTTNGRGLTRQIVEASLKYCGAVAVTAHTPYNEMASAVRRLVAAGVRTNVHFVLDEHSVNTAIKWLKAPPKLLDGINALVFLNYKPVGRMRNARGLLRHSPRLQEFFQFACSSNHRFRIGFDSCLVSGLTTFSRVNPVWFDACEAARFSMCISEDSLAFPCSFMKSTLEGFRVEKGNLQKIWHKSLLFQKTRRLLFDSTCKGCPHSLVCMGGCPLFEEINLCSVQRSHGLSSLADRAGQ